MQQGYFHRVSAQTSTRFWINNVTREEAALALEAGAVGCTQNPSYTWKMLSDPEEGAHALELARNFMRDEPDDNEVVVKLQRALVGDIAKCFLPLYEKTYGRQGFVSIQGDPFREDVDTILAHARYNREAGPNIMAKIPVTEEGLEAIAVLAAEGVPINATEVMSVRQALDVCRVYTEATKGMASPAPIYYSHIAGIFDEYLAGVVRDKKIDISSDSLWQAGIAVAKKIYAMVHDQNYAVGFIGGGARGLHHFTEMVGADANITINWKGTADRLIESNPPVLQNFWRPVPHAVLDELLEKLPDFEKAYVERAIEPAEYEHYGPVVLFRESFESAWKSAVAFIANHR